MKHLAILGVVLAVAATPALANEKDMEGKAQFYFNKMDTDSNGSVSNQEHATFSKSKFDEADTNNDDMLSLDELKAYKKKEKDEYKSNQSMAQ